jgi:hypothetical protein
VRAQQRRAWTHGPNERTERPDSWDSVVCLGRHHARHYCYAGGCAREGLTMLRLRVVQREPSASTTSSLLALKPACCLHNAASGRCIRPHSGRTMTAPLSLRICCGSLGTTRASHRRVPMRLALLPPAAHHQRSHGHSHGPARPDSAGGWCGRRFVSCVGSAGSQPRRRPARAVMPHHRRTPPPSSYGAGRRCAAPFSLSRTLLLTPISLSPCAGPRVGNRYVPVGAGLLPGRQPQDRQ